MKSLKKKGVNSGHTPYKYNNNINQITANVLFCLFVMCLVPNAACGPGLSTLD